MATFPLKFYKMARQTVGFSTTPCELITPSRILLVLFFFLHRFDASVISFDLEFGLEDLLGVLDT